MFYNFQAYCQLFFLILPLRQLFAFRLLLLFQDSGHPDSFLTIWVLSNMHLHLKIRHAQILYIFQNPNKEVIWRLLWTQKDFCPHLDWKIHEFRLHLLHMEYHLQIPINFMVESLLFLQFEVHFCLFSFYLFCLSYPICVFYLFLISYDLYHQLLFSSFHRFLHQKSRCLIIVVFFLPLNLN